MSEHGRPGGNDPAQREEELEATEAAVRRARTDAAEVQAGQDPPDERAAPTGLGRDHREEVEAEAEVRRREEQRDRAADDDRPAP